jgi:mannan endo-1,4-beta-mannosidase
MSREKVDHANAAGTVEELREKPKAGTMTKLRKKAPKAAITLAGILLIAGAAQARTRVVQTLTIIPNPAALIYGGETQQLTAMLNGQPTSSVTWSLSYGLGTVSTTGLYRAPADQTGWNTVVATATSTTVAGLSASVSQPVGPAPIAPPVTTPPVTTPPVTTPPVTTPPPVGGSTAQRPSWNTGTGFFVVSGQIYDPKGVAFRPVGINKLHWDGPSPGLLDSSNPTRSNAVRWVIDFNQTSQTNLALMKKSSDAAQVAIPGNWDGTCNSSPALLTAIVDKWIAQSATWLTVDNQILLNIANEWGPANSTDWRDAYITAIGRLRAAGYRAPIVVDSGGCGQDPTDVISFGQAVFNSDPQKNVVFDLHIYGAWANGNGNMQNDLNSSLDKLKATGLPVMCGEFGPGKNIGPSPTMMTPGEIIQACSARGFGWFSWAFDDPDGEFTQNGCDDSWFCMSRTGGYSSSSDLTLFGRDVIENPTYGIKATSQKATIFP